MINKVINSFDEAVADIFDGAVVLMGGFGPANGTPSNLLRAVVKRGVTNLTLVANTPGYGRDEPGAKPFRLTPPNYDDGGLLIQNGQVSKVICAFPGIKRPDAKALLHEMREAGRLIVEMVPQGTLAERIRAAKAGISAFYIPTGAGTILENGKDTRYFNGVKNILEYPIKADFALIRAHKADRYGNLVYQGTSRNFNSVIAEVDELVPLGSLDPEVIVTASVYVNRIVVRENSAKGAL
jgi:3-oxoadipate CoA-transferase alpha subunit